jgi:hypothetical protein
MRWPRKSLSEPERQDEIARLVAQRDRMLERAPKSFLMSRFVVSIMLVMFVLSVSTGFFRHPEKISVGAVIFFVIFGLFLIQAAWKLWVNPPPPGDRWGMSDRIGYDGDSPRDIQRKIDDLTNGRV